MCKFGDWRSCSGIAVELSPMMQHSNHDESSILIGPCSDKMATCRWPHGGVAVLEAKNKSVNTAKNQ